MFKSDSVGKMRASANTSTAEETLIKAVLDGKRLDVRKAIRNGADPSLLVGDCIPLIFIAAARGNLGVVREISEAGADLQARDGISKQPILAYLSSIPTTPALATIIRYLITIGADINAGNYCSVTPLEIAIVYGNKTCVDILVNAGATATGSMQKQMENLKRLSKQTGSGIA